MILNKEAPVVVFKGVEKSFLRKKVLDNVSFSLPQGIVLGLLGPNGSGKTTILNIIAGLYRPSKGEVLVGGSSPHKRLRENIAYVPEYEHLYSWMKVQEHLRFLRAFFADWDDKVAEELLDFMGLPGDQVVGTLSRGMRARLKLLTSMARSAPLILMDEPFSGIDSASRGVIMQAILKRFQGEGQTMILSTHEIYEVEPLFDEVLFLKEGKVFLHEKAEALREEKRMSLDGFFKEVYR